jgi:HSP20 family protein
MARKGKTEDLNLGGVFRSLGGFIDLLSSLSEQGEISRSGQVEDGKERVKAVYGFSVRVGGDKKPHVAQFGNVKSDGPAAVVEESREPMVDIFDEDEFVLVVAELPGVSAEDISFELKEDILVLTAAHGERKYRKELLLPCTVDKAEASSSYRNGVFELKLLKAR